MRLFISLFLSFIVIYVIIVISHECGHYVAARAMGYSTARIHYNHTDTGVNKVLAAYRQILNRNKEAINNDIPFAEKDRLLQLNAAVNKMGDALQANKYYFGKGSLFIYAAGPLVTVLIASIGILLLLLYQDSFKKTEQLTTGQWFIAFAALMWFKPLYELTGVVTMQLIKGHVYLFTDEYKMCTLLGIYPSTINIIEALAGILPLYLTIKFVPATQRLTLVIAALSGGITGFILWHFLGPIILP